MGCCVAPFLLMGLRLTVLFLRGGALLCFGLLFDSLFNVVGLLVVFFSTSRSASKNTGLLDVVTGDWKAAERQWGPSNNQHSSHLWNMIVQVYSWDVKRYAMKWAQPLLRRECHIFQLLWFRSWSQICQIVYPSVGIDKENILLELQNWQREPKTPGSVTSFLEDRRSPARITTHYTVLQYSVQYSVQFKTHVITTTCSDRKRRTAKQHWIWCLPPPRFSNTPAPWWEPS